MKLIVARARMSILAPRNEPIMRRQRATTATHSFLKTRGANYGRATRRIRVQHGTMARSLSRSSTRREREEAKGVFVHWAGSNLFQCGHSANKQRLRRTERTYLLLMTYLSVGLDRRIKLLFLNRINQVRRIRHLNAKWIHIFCIKNNLRSMRTHKKLK